MSQFLVSELVEAINQANADQFKVSAELSTLVEFDDYSTIMVDRKLELEGFGTVILTYEAMLDENEDGRLECSGIDANSENTYIHIEYKGSFIYDSQSFEPTELASVTSFKNEILNTKLNEMDADTVNHLLKQILIDYAH